MRWLIAAQILCDASATRGQRQQAIEFIYLTLKKRFCPHDNIPDYQVKSDALQKLIVRFCRSDVPQGLALKTTDSGVEAYCVLAFKNAMKDEYRRRSRELKRTTPLDDASDLEAPHVSEPEMDRWPEAESALMTELVPVVCRFIPDRYQPDFLKYLLERMRIHTGEITYTELVDEALTQTDEPSKDDPTVRRRIEERIRKRHVRVIERFEVAAERLVEDDPHMSQRLAVVYDGLRLKAKSEK